MTFTDDDLKRLKTWFDYAELKFNGHRLDEFYREISYAELKALVVRLATAEDAVQQAYRCTSDNKEYYKKWLEVSGKNVQTR